MFLGTFYRTPCIFVVNRLWTVQIIQSYVSVSIDYLLTLKNIYKPRLIFPVQTDLEKKEIRFLNSEMFVSFLASQIANSAIAVMKCFAIALFIFFYFIADIFTANYNHLVDEDFKRFYKILKDPAERTFTKSKE